MFYFEQLLQTALSGIDAANVTGAVLGLAGTVLLLSFLYSAYQAFAAGGDVRMLAISGIKYLMLGLVFANYGAVFRDVNGMFNSAADFIHNSTGVGDVFANWMNQLSQYWQSNGNTSLWNLVTGLASGVISLWLILGAFVIFPVCYLIFTVFYAMYGSVLYVTGPLVLALLPTRGLGQLSRTYLINLMTFHTWGLIYAIIQVLMSAVNLSSIDAVLGANGILNSFVGSSQMILLALTASIFSFSIALIPFIASRIVRGDVGSTMLTLVSTASAAAGGLASLATASFAGVGEGALVARSAGDGPPPPPPPQRPDASSGPAPTGVSDVSEPVTVGFESMPPTPMLAATLSGTSDREPSGEKENSPPFTTSQPSSASVRHSSSSLSPKKWIRGRYSVESAYRGMSGKE